MELTPTELAKAQSILSGGQITTNPYTKEVAFSPVSPASGYTNFAPKSEMGSASTSAGAALIEQKKATEEKLTPITGNTTPSGAVVNATTGELISPAPEKPSKGMSFQDAVELFGADFTGVHNNPDGTFTPDRTAIARLGVKTTADPTQQEQLDKAKADFESAKSKLDNFSASMANDPALISILNGISAGWEQRVREQEQTNKSKLAATKTAGIRFGSRYMSPGGGTGVFDSIITGQENAGLALIADLNAKKDAALAEARSAYETKKWTQYAKMVDLAETQYSESKKAVAELVKTQAAEDKKRKEAERLSSMAGVIGNLRDQGITEPSQLMDFINNYEDGSSTGANLTAEEFDKIWKVINPDEKLAGLNADYKTFKHLQEIEDPAVTGMTYFNYLDAIQNAKAKPSIREYVVNGRRIRDIIDPATGAVTSSIDLGDAGETSGGGGLNNFTDIMQQVIDADGTPEQAAREAAIASENIGVQVDAKTLAEWTKQARELKKTPEEPKTEEEAGFFSKLFGG